MVSKLLYRLTANRPCRLIQLDSGPYLERYYIGQLFGLTFYLHRFVSADSERHLHNHPWRWGRSLILSGSYIEERVLDICPHASSSGCMTETRRIKWWNVVNDNTFHQISAAEPNTWTLFFHSERVTVDHGAGKILKGWGFLESADSELTIFRPFYSSNSEWWLTAPKGRDAGRVSREY